MRIAMRTRLKVFIGGEHCLMEYFHFLSISYIEQKWVQSKHTNHLSQKLD